jgi:hypothetical protein
MKKPFWKRHLFGWIMAVLTVIGGYIAPNIWAVYQGPIGAEIAVQQVQDSATAFAAHQAVNYGGLVPTVISVIAVLAFVAFLFPTIRDLVKGDL